MLRRRHRRPALFIGVAVAAFAIAFAVSVLVGGDDGTHAGHAKTAASRAPAAAAATTSAPQAPARRAPPPDPLAHIRLGRLVGQMVMAGMDGTWPSPALLSEIRTGRVGGVLLFQDNVSPDLSGAIQAMQSAARAGGNPPLLISVDQEGGPVKRLSDGPPTISPRLITDAATAQSQGAATGRFLAGTGINVDLAPVSDVATSPASFIASEGRGFDGGPPEVAARADAFMQGLQSAGVAATAKHFPGVGGLAVDTDNFLGTISSPRSELDAALTPFKREVDDGVALVMVASAIYPALDPTRRPADMSPAIIGGVLRQRLGFRGVVITDALDTPSQLGGTPADRAVRAAQAGADIILFAPADNGPEAFAGLIAAARSGSLGRAQLERSYARITALKRRVAAGR